MTPLRVNTDSPLHWHSTRGATAVEDVDTSEKGEGGMCSLKSHQMILANIPFSLSPSPLPDLSEKSQWEVWDPPCWRCGLEEQLGREVRTQAGSRLWKSIGSDMGFGLEVGGESWSVFGLRVTGLRVMQWTDWERREHRGKDIITNTVGYPGRYLNRHQYTRICPERSYQDGWSNENLLIWEFLKVSVIHWGTKH